MLRFQIVFQSPRTGKFESNFIKEKKWQKDISSMRFNPLERGNSNQINPDKNLDGAY